MQAKTFVFFGIVGSGKGTQAKLLEEYLKSNNGLDVVYISSGNEYRKIIQEDTETAKLIQTVLNRGQLLPDFLTNAVFTNILINQIASNKHLITDGYPRSISQAQCLEDAVEFYSRGEVHVIYIELGKEEAISRMKLRGRHDDTDEGITKRFEEYIDKVVPAMKHFENHEKHKVITINGEQSIENVHKDIIKALNF